MFFMPILKLTVLFPVLFVWHSLLAQPSDASFLHYNTDQGLSNDHITAIAKDNSGFLWVGTVNGLNRFDGRSFKIFRYDPQNKNSLPDDNVIGITLAPNGCLWVATSGGLCKIDPVWLEIQRIALPENADTLQNDAVTQVAFDSEGMAWTTGESGIYKINPVTGKQEQFFKTEQKNLGWFGMLIDQKDRLWLIKEALRRFDPATQSLKLFNGVNPDEPFVAAATFSLVQDFSGQIWAGTWGAGIWKYVPELDEFAKTGWPETLCMMLMPDTSASGAPFFWVGGGKSGLAIYYPDARRIIEFKPDPQDPFTHNNYLAKTFFRDPSNGDVWIGTEVGLEQYAPATIRFGRAIIPPEKDMGQFSLVSGVVHDNTDPAGQRYFVAVWGTGLFAWNKTTRKFTRMKSTRSRLTGGTNFNLLQDSRGYLWGCMRAGMGRYNPKTGEWRDYEKVFAHEERNNVFWCGLEDRHGNLWFGSNKEGLFRYNSRSDRIEPAFYRKSFTHEDGYLNITAISEDTLGRLWLACNASGLIRYDPVSGEAKQFFYPVQNIPLVCNSVEAGSNGKIYAAFYGSFLELDADGKLLRQFTQRNGLKTNRVFYLVEDRQGKIWFNSEYLLHCFDPANGTFTYYGKPDGLFSNTITDGLSVTPGGEIFVGFQNAFNFFYPDRLRRNLQPPPIAVTSIKVMNKARQLSTRNAGSFNPGLFPVNFGGAGPDTFLLLNPGEDFFEIEFAALSFNQQERNRYAYKLEGFNQDWVFTERPVATFTNLDGGQYLLRMKAANNDGVWNEQGVTLKIRVNPPFYTTWWFPVLLALAIAGVVAGLFWFRWQQQQRLERFRESLARDLHDEMGSTLSSIRFFSEFASQQIGQDKPLVTPVLQRISESASTLSEFMQDVIWAMKTKNDQLEDLAARMTEFGLYLLEARNVDFTTHVSEDFSGTQLQPEVRRNIYLIFKEAVNNAAKYSQATEVELQFTLKKGLLLMVISDNGVGFEPDNLPAGGSRHGLQNMRLRAADIGGKLEIHSGIGKGTRIELRVKV